MSVLQPVSLWSRSARTDRIRWRGSQNLYRGQDVLPDNCRETSVRRFGAALRRVPLVDHASALEAMSCTVLPLVVSCQWSQLQQLLRSSGVVRCSITLVGALRVQSTPVPVHLRSRWKKHKLAAPASSPRQHRSSASCDTVTTPVPVVDFDVCSLILLSIFLQINCAHRGVTFVQGQL